MKSEDMNSREPVMTGKQIQSVQRAINILNCFTAAASALTLSQISSRVNLNKGTVHGILNTLRNNGYISQNLSGQYMLGPELFAKASLAPYTRRNAIADFSHEQLQVLSDRYESNGTIFTIDDNELFVIDYTSPTQSAFIIQKTSSRIPLHASASGKILLANMSSTDQEKYLMDNALTGFTPKTKTSLEKLKHDFSLIRKSGVAYEEDELYTGISAIAVPILSHYNSFMSGTLSLTGLTANIRKNRQEISKALLALSKQISEAISY